ncbi:MAG: GtrA family protein [Verrucomicrobiaceae bacterium]|nr:GtrA family protein [Verrucomicrobiaceae bacterium]
MTSAIKDAIDFLRHNDLPTILTRIRAREVPPLIQFAAYSVCGGLATVVFLGVVLALTNSVLPAEVGLKVNDHPVEFSHKVLWWPSASAPDHSLTIAKDHQSDDIRAQNLLVCNFIAFMLANIVAYVTNVLFVFKTGRHHPILEFLFFTAVSGVAFGISQIAGPWLIHQFGLATKLAILTNVVASMLLNFAGRKFFVFKG